MCTHINTETQTRRHTKTKSKQSCLTLSPKESRYRANLAQQSTGAPPPALSKMGEAATTQDQKPRHSRDVTEKIILGLSQLQT